MPAVLWTSSLRIKVGGVLLHCLDAEAHRLRRAFVGVAEGDAGELALARRNPGSRRAAARELDRTSRTERCGDDDSSPQKAARGWRYLVE
jgi:hypothetical protein